jgi:hypothetical protein
MGKEVHARRRTLESAQAMSLSTGKVRGEDAQVRVRLEKMRL